MHAEYWTRTHRSKNLARVEPLRPAHFLSAHTCAKRVEKMTAKELAKGQSPTGAAAPRHEDFGTTMKYYVGHDADTKADTTWVTEDNSLGNTSNAADSTR